MGIQKSKLNKKIIEQILIEEYNIKPTKIEEINRGTANIFKTETSTKSYILKEFNEKRTIESIEKEISIYMKIWKRLVWN